MASATSSAPATRDHEIRRVRELSKSGRHADALAAAETICVADPRNRDALYLLAANQRCLNQLVEALATLEQLEQNHPDYSLLYQERGHCYMALRDAPRAIEAFLRAVALNPALTASWAMLERALDLAPNLHALRLNYVRALLDDQKYLQALDTTSAQLAREPDNAEWLSLNAAACAGLGRHVDAIASYRRLLASSSPSAELHVLLGHSLKAIGRVAEAIDAYKAAAGLRPAFGDAYWSLANLKTYRFSREEIAHMRDAESAPSASVADRSHFCFALGKAYEDERDFAASWQFYKHGNALKLAESHYRPEVIDAITRQQIELFTREFFTARAGSGAAAPDPIFIVGLPRSGSTLLEQILASHSQVDGTQELYEIPRIARELVGLRALAVLSPDDCRALGERYIQATRAYRTGKLYFTDKMPNNFRHVGLIHLILPNAKIIDMRREPIACSLSNWKQLFAAGQEFTYSLDHIARYYRAYLGLMRHWEAALPGRILRVSYEDLVDDLEENVRRVLDFCSLKFESACIDFHRTRRSIRTPSSEQVRQPLSRDGLESWRNFEPWLAPLKQALGDALTRYRE